MPTYEFAEQTYTDDDRGLTRQYVLPIRLACDNDLLEDPCQNWNEVRCNADLPYMQPVENSDTIWLQTKFPDPINTWTDGSSDNNPYALNWNEEGSSGTFFIKIFAVNYCTGEETEIELTDDYVEAAWVGRLRVTSSVSIPKMVQGQTVQTIGVKAALLPDEFFFRIEHATLGNFYTELYSKIECGNTVLLEGRYDAQDTASSNPFGVAIEVDVDCDGYIYGWDEFSDHRAYPNILSYQNKKRVKGSFELEGYNNERTQNKRGILFGVTVTENYRFRTYPVPFYVAKQIQSIFTSDYIVINDDSDSIWQIPEAVEKNNELGTMWAINSMIKRQTCERKRGCD